MYLGWTCTQMSTVPARRDIIAVWDLLTDDGVSIGVTGLLNSVISPINGGSDYSKSVVVGHSERFLIKAIGSRSFCCSLSGLSLHIRQVQDGIFRDTLCFRTSKRYQRGHTTVPRKYD